MESVGALILSKRYPQAKKENPPHVQAHLILFVPHKIKRAFTSPPPPDNIYNHFMR